MRLENCLSLVSFCSHHTPCDEADSGQLNENHGYVTRVTTTDELARRDLIKKLRSSRFGEGQYGWMFESALDSDCIEPLNDVWCPAQNFQAVLVADLFLNGGWSGDDAVLCLGEDFHQRCVFEIANDFRSDFV